MTIASNKKILIVDDMPENIDLCQDIFSDSFSIMAALSGEEALEIIDEGHHPDLIILDITMPGMNGFELCRRLREIENIHSIPIVFISACVSEQEKQEAFNVGANDIIKKPYSVARLRQRIDELLHG